MNQPRPRIGMHALGTGSGGIWRYVHAILRSINLKEFEVLLFSDVLATYEPRPEIRVIPLSKGVVPWHASGASAAVAALHPLNCGHAPTRLGLAANGPLKLWAGTVRDAWRLSRDFRGGGLDLLHTNQTGCEEAPIAARMAGVRRVVGTFHIDPTYDLLGLRDGFRHRAIEFASNHCLSRGIGVSSRTSRDWIERTQMAERRVVTIHNGIDAGRFQRRTDCASARRAFGLSDDVTHVIGGIGRLEAAKGFEYLIAAIPQLLRSFPQLVVLIAGEGPLRAALEEHAESIGVQANVRFIGFTQEVQSVLDCLDVFVLPSLCETLGYAHLEAMATGIPAVGTTVGGVPEVIVHGATGLLVPPRDSDSLAAALRKLLESKELRRTMGAAGRERVARRFNEAEMVGKTLDLYRELLPAHKHPRG